MEYRVNRRTGDRISVLGVGTSGLPAAGAKEGAATLEMALEQGINYFDLATAESACFPIFGAAFAGVRDRVLYQVHFGANYAPGKSYSWTTDLETIKRSVGWQLEQLNLKQSELSELEEQLKVLDADRKMSEEDMQAIDISMNAITEMTARIHGSFGLQLADYISQLFSYISNGAHKKLNIDEKFQVTVDDDRKLLQPQQLSAGTVDQIYFSVRMAVSQMLYDEPMPLILDDSFVLYDDERLKNTLRWLTEQKAFSQILIFTCHHREAEMLESLNCDYHYVEL